MDYDYETTSVYKPLKELLSEAKVGENWNQMFLALLYSTDPQELLEARRALAGKTFEEAVREAADQHDLDHVEFGLVDSTDVEKPVATDGSG